MSIRKGLHYDRKRDLVFGYEDDGNFRTTELADSALCFMAKGCVTKWKQTIGYILTNGAANEKSIIKLLRECIAALEKEGFIVLGVTTDLGQNFQAAFKSLGVSASYPYFLIENKTYLVYKDPPHLLRCSRNFVLNNEVNVPKFDNHKAKWSHLVNLLKLNEVNNLVLAPRITNKHLFGLKFQNKMKVNLAAQVLSNSCSAALDFFTAHRIMEPEVSANSSYCKNMNDLFDILNSSYSKDRVPLRRSLCPLSPSWEKLK